MFLKRDAPVPEAFCSRPLSPGTAVAVFSNLPSLNRQGLHAPSTRICAEVASPSWAVGYRHRRGCLQSGSPSALACLVPFETWPETEGAWGPEGRSVRERFPENSPLDLGPFGKSRSAREWCSFAQILDDRENHSSATTHMTLKTTSKRPGSANPESYHAEGFGHTANPTSKAQHLQHPSVPL